MQKLKDTIQDENRQKFIIELLELEEQYEYEHPDRKKVKKSFQNVIDEYYPFEDQNE